MTNSNYRDYGYTSHESIAGEAGRDLAEAFVELVSAYPVGASVCDIGCGNGYLAAQLAKRGYSVTGFDASETGIAIARENYGADNARFFRAELDTDSVALIPGAGAFQVAVSSDVIEHLYRPSALARAAARLLEPHGVLLVGTPYHGYLKNVLISALGFWDRHHGVHWDGGHIKFFSTSTLRELLEANGFAVEGFRFDGRVRWLWKNMICIARRNI